MSINDVYHSVSTKAALDGSFLNRINELYWTLSYAHRFENETEIWCDFLEIGFVRTEDGYRITVTETSGTEGHTRTRGYGYAGCDDSRYLVKDEEGLREFIERTLDSKYRYENWR